ncbi:hypothetical protein JRQ81_011491 [Phrynocephalus forsythii]|uniref:Apolipoprotein E n=1 Tax=Phrynocephalus forsythii TaxID=171643 RepID=A0A9Q1AQ38_9SAUR|nr:hypothetical protein JRQ81_011491 [Phrynocephalus forsythii]
MSSTSAPVGSHLGGHSIIWNGIVGHTFLLFFLIVLLFLPISFLHTGSWANPVFQEEPRSKWEETVEVFWDYVTRIGNAADDVTTQIKSSQISKELDGLITDTMAEVEAYTDDLRSKLGPYAQEVQQRLTAEVSTLSGKLRGDMEETKSKVVQYTNDARVMIDHNLDVLRSQLGLYMRKLKKRLSKDAEDLRRKMAAYTEEVRASTGEKVDAVRQSLQPYLSKIREKGQERFQALQQAVGEQGKMVHEQLSSRAQELHDHLRDKAEEVKGSFDQFAEKMNQWFAPYLQDISNQVQALTEKFNNLQS